MVDADAALPEGSSPRVRGKRFDKLAEAAGNRLIPACAGKTWAIGAVPDFAGAHPRVCGENVVTEGAARNA